MKRLRSFFEQSPVLSAITLTITWFILVMLFSGMATGLLNKEFGDPVTTLIGHLAGIIFVIILLWQLGWLKNSGILQPGRLQVWLISIAGTIFFALASLYSFFGTLRFDLSTITDFSASGNILIAGIANCLGEEILFRGVFLYTLIRSLGSIRRGRIRSVVITSGVFALFHLLHVAFYGQSPGSALIMVLEVFIISAWWASMVLKGGSIWPAFLAHFVINMVIALQSTIHTIVQPDLQVYLKLLAFSIPLGLTAIWLLLKIPDKHHFNLTN